MPVPERIGEGLLFFFRTVVDHVETQQYLESAKVAVESIVPGASVAGSSLTETIAEGKMRQFQLRARVVTRPQLQVEVSLLGEGLNASSGETDNEIRDTRYRDEDFPRRIVERIKLNILRVLSQAFGIPVPPWGILVGVRPTKLVHSLKDLGFSWREVEERLQSVYGVSAEKAGLALKVARRQRQFFLPQALSKKTAAVYVGIPFCPSRCSYCSFAAYPLHSHGHLAKGFLKALHEEMDAVGSLIKRHGIRIESIYFGGGTPTVFDVDTTESLVSKAAHWFLQTGTREFTVEAGRPDTICDEKLAVLRHLGVNRISVNPQTLCDETLRTIGRHHSSEDFFRAFSEARKQGFPVINVDLIVGLPGETIETVAATLAGIGKLRPENLTIHSLALKRAANLKRSGLALPGQNEAVEMLSLAQQTAADLNLTPFYLYRQRYIVGDLENVGYALPGSESVFNIQMMEERQTIIGLGGGAVTKLVDPGTWRLYRLSNPKCPAAYAKDSRAIIDIKLSHLSRHFESTQ